jgi:hypothetical protein
VVDRLCDEPCLPRVAGDLARGPETRGTTDEGIGLVGSVNSRQDRAVVVSPLLQDAARRGHARYWDDPRQLTRISRRRWVVLPS